MKRADYIHGQRRGSRARRDRLERDRWVRLLLERLAASFGRPGGSW